MKGAERQMKDVRNNVAISGIGWIASGIVSIGTGYVLSGRALEGNPGNLIYIGVLLIAIGIVMLAIRNRVAEVAFGAARKKRGR